MENFCRDMEYYEADNLNNLIRWAVYAYGYDNAECIDTNYAQLIERMAVTNWETSAYPRRKCFFRLWIIPPVSAENKIQ